MDQEEFADLMHTVARAWTEGDPHAAAACFAEDVVYVEPPDRQIYRGRAEVLELSTSDTPMSMQWHHLAFDGATGVGFGEYTFRGRRQYHGIVIVRVEDGKIARWREYQYQDDSAWREFVGDSSF
jgi:ketosteroid isomerase-like protein